MGLGDCRRADGAAERLAGGRLYRVQRRSPDPARGQDDVDPHGGGHAVRQGDVLRHAEWARPNLWRHGHPDLQFRRASARCGRKGQYISSQIDAGLCQAGRQMDAGPRQFRSGRCWALIGGMRAAPRGIGATLRLLFLSDLPAQTWRSRSDHPSKTVSLVPGPPERRLAGVTTTTLPGLITVWRSWRNLVGASKCSISLALVCVPFPASEKWSLIHCWP